MKAVFVVGVVPCTERAETDRSNLDCFDRGDRKIVISLTKREIKHKKGVWRMPWH
jgi:hypothetical protein